MTKEIKKKQRSKAITAKNIDGKLTLVISNEHCKEFSLLDKDFQEKTLNQLIHASCRSNDLSEVNGSVAALIGIKPRDVLETMLAAQMVTVHNLSMEISRRALLPDQTIEGVNDNINRMTKLMRTYTQQVEALQKYRTKGNQKITVQHVQVNDGGKAVIGDVNTGGGNG